MPRYDKYDPISGGTRARLAVALPLTNGSFFGGVSLNASGRVLVGHAASSSGLIGVVVKNVARGPLGPNFVTTNDGLPNPYAPVGAQVGDVVDIMQHGDIVDLDKTAFPAGRPVYALPNGNISITSATGAVQIGWTIEAGRLVVRFGPGIPAAA